MAGARDKPTGLAPSAISLEQIRPIQAMVLGLLLKHRRLMVQLPRQYGGKTEIGIRAQQDICRRRFTSSGLFLAKNHLSRKKATREKFMRIFDPDYFEVNEQLIYNRQFETSQIFMGSVDKQPDAERGGTYNFLHWSEVAFAELVHGETITGVFGKVMKPLLSMKDGYAFLESTNNGKNGWFDIWESYKEFGFHRFRMPFSLMAELGLVPLAEYEKEKRETLPDIFRQEYECEWVSFSGKAYPYFTDDLIDANVPPPEEWQMVGSGIDWGYHPSATAVLFAYVVGDYLVIFDEHYAHHELPMHTAEAIQRKRQQYGIRHHAAVADHEQDRIDELNLRGIECGPAQKVNVLGARLQISELMWKKKLKIHPRCKYLIKDLQAATWHPKKGQEDLDPTQCGWGHYDAEAALRYLVRELSGFEREEPVQNPQALDQGSARAWLMTYRHKGA